LSHPLALAPESLGFQTQLTDAHTLEVEVPKGMELNALFGKLSAAGVAVKSLRNKTNRLEELFVRIVGDSQSGSGAGL
jgi:ABC-2 type transport system ATP-binding protein